MPIAAPYSPPVAPATAPAARWRETERLNTLRGYDLLGSAPEPIFDEITKLASQICDVPFALIELIGETGSWIKSVTGALPVAELARHNGFSRMVVDTAEPLEIADAPHDLRFHHDPLVTGAPRIRFYCGVPLLAPNGHVLGALSVVHTQANVLTPAQRAGLHQLSDVVVRLFESRRHEETAAWLGDILDESLNEIVVIDAQTRRIHYANEGARKNLGYGIEELTALSTKDLIVDWTDERRHALAGGLLGGAVKQITVELELMRKDGTVYTADVRAQRSRYRGREVFVVIANDITARKRAEEQLHREKEFAQITLASIGDALVTTDEKGIVTYLNPVAERLTGWTLQSATGREAWEVFRIVSESDRMKAECPVDRVLRTGEVTGLANNTMLLSLDGGEYSVEDSAAPIRGKDGRIAGVVLVFRDVSQQKEMEDLRNDFIAMMSHELRTPLTGMKGYLKMLLHRKAREFDMDKIQGIVTIINHQADQLQRLIADLMEAAKIRNEALEIHPIVCDLIPLLRQAVASQALSGFEMSVSAPTSVMVSVDGSKYGDVLAQLLSNAAKYSLPGGKISLNCRVDQTSSKTVVVDVIDEGVGIPPEQLERIFDMFHRVDNSNSRVHYGVGLGLFLSRKILQAHGGNIVATSIMGCGSTFSVSLPFHPEIQTGSTERG